MFVVADVVIAAGAMFVVVVFVVISAAVALLLLKCSHHYHNHHHHQNLHNLKDGYNSMLKSLNFVLVVLALYVNFSLKWEKRFEISTES